MNKDYRIEVYPIKTSSGKEWVAEYIDLPYCVGGGVTEEEAIKEAKENLEVYLDTLKALGKDIPAPSDHITENDFSGNIIVRLPKSLHKDVSEISKREKASINTTVVSFLSREVEKYKAEEGVEKGIEEYRSNTEKQLNRIVVKQKIGDNDCWIDNDTIMNAIEWS